MTYIWVYGTVCHVLVQVVYGMNFYTTFIESHRAARHGRSTVYHGCIHVIHSFLNYQSYTGVTDSVQGMVSRKYHTANKMRCLKSFHLLAMSGGVRCKIVEINHNKKHI